MEDWLANVRLVDRFGKVGCERTWKWDTRRQPLEDCDLWYAWSGEGRLVLNGRPYDIGKGTCFLLKPGDRTYAEHRPQHPLTVTFIHFALPPSAASTLPASHRVVEDTLLFETHLNRYTEAMMNREEDGALEAKLLLTLMLLQLRREETQSRGAPADPLSAAIRMIAHRVRQTPGEPHSAASMAEAAKLSPRYFALKFKQVMGVTVEQFLIRNRIERAEHLLRHNGMNASEVAEALGYKDLSFFSRQFKRVRGKTPSAIKKEGAARRSAPGMYP